MHALLNSFEFRSLILSMQYEYQITVYTIIAYLPNNDAKIIRVKTAMVSLLRVYWIKWRRSIVREALYIYISYINKPQR